MRKMHREPEVLEAEAQVEECLDCRARITSNQLAPLHSVKNGIIRSDCSASPTMDANLVISALTHTAKQLSKTSKKNGGKIAVATYHLTQQGMFEEIAGQHVRCGHSTGFTTSVYAAIIDMITTSTTGTSMWNCSSVCGWIHQIDGQQRFFDDWRD